MGNLHYHSTSAEEKHVKHEWSGRITLNKDNLTKLEMTGSLKLN